MHYLLVNIICALTLSNASSDVERAQQTLDALYTAIKKISTMAHRLNTNKQFMVGNGILAFAVIFVVVIFVYMSMRLQREKQEECHFIESYTISLVKGFAGDSISLFVKIGRAHV